MSDEKPDDDRAFLIRRMWQHWRDTLLDLIFPPLCLHCGRVDAMFCARCYDQLAQHPLRSTHTHQDGLTIYATGTHAGILQSAVQALKYHGVRTIAPYLAQRMTLMITQQNLTFDTIIPVPLHTHRLRQRGYNQAKDLADALGEQTGHPVQSQAIRRIRDTRSQVGLDYPQRQANMQDAFLASAEEVRGQKILLIDDVQTTGATLVACADAIHRQGADAVYGLTVTTA